MLPESKDKGDSVAAAFSEQTQRKYKKQESSEESTDEEQSSTETEEDNGDFQVEKSKASPLKDKGTAIKSSGHGKRMSQRDEDNDGDDISSDDSDQGHNPHLYALGLLWMN